MLHSACDSCRGGKKFASQLHVTQLARARLRYHWVDDLSWVFLREVQNSEEKRLKTEGEKAEITHTLTRTTQKKV